MPVARECSSSATSWPLLPVSLILWHPSCLLIKNLGKSGVFVCVFFSLVLFIVFVFIFSKIIWKQINTLVQKRTALVSHMVLLGNVLKWSLMGTYIEKSTFLAVKLIFLCTQGLKTI